MPTILLIDDSKTVLEAARLALAKNQDFTLETLSDPSLALNKILEIKPSMIVIDHDLSPKNGYDLAEELRKNTGVKKIPIMLLVGPHIHLDPQKAMTIGIAGAISKPFTVEHLLTSLQAALTAPKAKSSKKSAPQNAAATAPNPTPDLSPSPLSPPIIPNNTTAPGYLAPPPMRSDSLLPPAIAGSVSQEALESTIRKIIEEVVWEVVPSLAESMIKEELNRLLKS